MNKYFKKTIVIFILSIGFILSSIPSSSINLKDNNYINNKNNFSLKLKEINLSFSPPQIKYKNNCTEINIIEADSSIFSPGKPILPKSNILMKFPLGSIINNIQIITAEVKQLTLSKTIAISPYPLTNYVKINFLKNIFYKDSYRESEIYPKGWFEYKIGGGLDCNNHVTFLSIQLYPVRYMELLNKIEYVENLKIKVEYLPPESPHFFPEVYDLLIIAPSEYSSNLDLLINHKNNHNISSKLVILEEINGIGRDKQEQIKYFIKDAIEQWGVKYVLLVGSIDKIPIRQTWIGNFDVLTDLYYSDIYFPDMSFSSWDTNNNDRFGEYWQASDDIVDLYPDVYIGRLACINKFEVSNIVNKIISYETSTYGKNWFNNLILCAGDTHPNGGLYEGEITAREIIKSTPEFTHIKLFTSDGTFSSSSINKAVNNGAGFIAYSGHGFENGLGTHPPNDDKWIYYLKPNLLGLFNNDKLPIIYFDACLTSRLDYTLGDLLKLPFIHFSLPCFAWCCVKKLIGGAIATIGASRVAFSLVTNQGPKSGSGYLALQFFKNYYQGVKIGEMFVSSQNDYLDNVWYDPMTIEEFVLLGDPSLVVGGYGE
jgi:hypothetical protein